jgi:hypothetical protein
MIIVHLVFADVCFVRQQSGISAPCSVPKFYRKTINTLWNFGKEFGH